MSEARNITQLFFLVIIQVMLLNQIHFWGFANPMLFLLFFMTYPYQESKSGLLLMAFFAGLFIDIFSDTGGVYAASTLCVVLVRPLFIRLFFGQNFDYQKINLFQISFFGRIVYMLLIAFLFHSLFYLFELFDVGLWLVSFWKVIFSTIFSVIVCLLSLYLFNPERK